MAGKATDLTILLRAVDKTKAGFSSVEKRMGKLTGISKKLSQGFVKVGASAVAALTAAAVNGRKIFNELDILSDTLGGTTREADALVKTIQGVAPGVEIDKLRDALLTLEEGFFDAHAEAGPLYALVKDFGVDIDLGVAGARNQLAEFLKVVNQLPSETDKVGALISNLGDADARVFVKMIRSGTDLNEVIKQLTGSIENIPGVIDDNDVAATDEYRDSVRSLSASWDVFSQEVFIAVAPALTAINNGLIMLTDLGTRMTTNFTNNGRAVIGFFNDINGKFKQLDQSITDKVFRFFGIEAFGFGGEAQESPTFTGRDLLGDTIKNIEEFNSSSLPKDPMPETPKVDIPVINEYGKFKNQQSFEEFYAERELRIGQSMDKAMNLRREATDREELRFLQELDAANNPRFSTTPMPEIDFPDGEDPELARIEAQSQGYRDMQSAIGSVASSIASLGEIASDSGSKAFKRFKQVQIAISTVAAISAAAQTLADTTNPTFLGKIAAYGKMLAIGLGAVAQLKSLNENSSAAPSAGASPSVPTGSQAAPIGGTAPEVTRESQRPRRNVNISIQGNGTFTADQVEELVEAINDVDTGTKINANRVAA